MHYPCCALGDKVDRMPLSSKSLEDKLARVRNLEDQLTFRLAVLSKLLDQQAQALLEGAQINLTSYRILIVIHTFGEISISDLSRFCAIDRAQVSRSAVRLGRRGLIAFREDATSKRKKIAVLTESGQELIDRFSSGFAARARRYDEALGPDRRAALIDAVNILTDHVSNGVPSKLQDRRSHSENP